MLSYLLGSWVRGNISCMGWFIIWFQNLALSFFHVFNVLLKTQFADYSQLKHYWCPGVVIRL